MDRLPAFSPAASARTRRNRRKPFLFMHLLHNLRTPPGWGRHPRASSPDFSLLNAIPFRIRSYEKTARNPFGIRTYETQHLKSFRIRTYKKNGGGGRVPMLNTPTPSGTATPLSPPGFFGPSLHRSPVAEHQPRPLCPSPGTAFTPTGSKRLCAIFFRSPLSNLQPSTACPESVEGSIIRLPENFYPPASNLRHNPAAQTRRTQLITPPGRIQ